MCLVVAELRFKPVFREQEDLAIRFPDAVAFHPFPMRRVDGRRVYLQFEVQQTALYEELHGRDSQPQPRGLHDRLHAWINQKILEELLDTLEPVAVHDIRDERIPLTLPELVEDGWRDALPVFRLVPGLDRMAQIAGDSKALIGRFRWADNFCSP